MKEECKLCSVGVWGGGAQTTDFSISSLMRPTVPRSAHMDPSQMLYSAYLLKLGDYHLYTLHNYYANIGEYRACVPLSCQADPTSHANHLLNCKRYEKSL